MSSTCLHPLLVDVATGSLEGACAPSAQRARLTLRGVTTRTQVLKFRPALPAYRALVFHHCRVIIYRAVERTYCRRPLFEPNRQGRQDKQQADTSQRDPGVGQALSQEEQQFPFRGADS